MKTSILNECLKRARQLNNPDSHPEFSNYIHYTFIVQDNVIVNYGMNRKANPLKVLGYPDYSKLHSEVDAYFRSKARLRRNDPYDVVNVRLNRHGAIKNSYPCKCCSAFLHKLGCKYVWFTTETETFAKLKLN